MTPSQINNITVERNSQNGLLYYSLKGNSYLLNVIQGDLFKIQDSDFNGFIISKAPEIRFYEIKTSDGSRTFVLMPTVQAIGGGGGGGLKMSQVTQMINGTANFIAKFTPDGHHVGNSLLFDNGTSIGFGTTTPNADATFDIQSTTQGFLVPRMTTLQRDAIPAPPDGLLVFNTTTELFSYWDATAGVWQNIDSQAGGDVSGSGTTNFVTKWTDGPNSVIGNSILFDDGTNVGIGINPANSKLQVAGAIRTGVASSVTGSLIFQNATNANTVTINSGVTSATYAVVLPTAQGGASTFLENDGAGNLSWGTVVLTNFYQNGGNAFGGNATIGLTDNFNWSFLTNNTVRGLIDNNGLWAIGSSSTTAGTRLAITSTGTTNATWIEQLFNSIPTLMFGVRDDGYITAGLANGSMTIGLSSGFISGIASNTFIGIDIASALTTSTQSTALGHQALKSLTSGNNNIAIGVTAGFNISDAISNIAIGVNALYGNVSANNNIAIGQQSLFTNTGADNIAIGVTSLYSNSTGVQNIGIGFQSIYFNSTGSRNVVIGYNAGIGNANFSDNVFLGYNSGFYETGSSKLFIDNQSRASEADARAKAMMYGVFSGTTANQFLRLNSNIGILTNTFGTNADGVLAIANGTAPTTTSASASQIFSANVAGAGTASLGLFVEQSVVTESVVSDNTLLVTINGTLYKILLKA